jgi:hypothetical protein
MATKDEHLQTIFATMVRLQGVEDSEVAHSDADELLIQAIAVLASGTRNKAVAQAIVDRWNVLDKWYA